MTNTSEDNLHYGKVRSINDSTIEVEVKAPIACSSCEVSSSCGIASDDLKLITIHNEQQNYSVGEHVKVVYQEELSSKALMVVYILPLFLLLIVMFIIKQFTDSELVIGLSMIVSLLPYFLLFKLFNKYIKKIFAFSIQKLNEEKLTNTGVI